MDRGRRRHPVALTAAGLGAIAGLRSMSAPALLSHRLSRDGAPPTHRLPERLLSSEGSARVFKVLAAGEMLVDKSPLIPARIDPLPLAGRALMGALTGTALAGLRGGPRLGPALVGAAAAVAASFAAYHLRRFAGERSLAPDPVLGALEDALVLGLGSRLARTA